MLAIAALLLAAIQPPHPCSDPGRLQAELAQLLTLPSNGAPVSSLNPLLRYLAFDPYLYPCEEDGLPCIELALVVDDGSRFIGQGIRVSLDASGAICQVTPVPSSTIEGQWVTLQRLRRIRRGMRFAQVVTLLCSPGRVESTAQGGFVATYALPADSLHPRSGFAFLHFDRASRLLRVATSYI